MAWGFVFNIYSVVCILVLLIESSVAYLDFTFENSKVCSMLRKRELKLQEKDSSAIFIKELRYFDNWSGYNHFYCNFSVTAPWNYGIFAVIQNLNLRQNDSTKDCIDYVQFQKRKAILPFYDAVKSEKFCGIVNSIHDPDATEKDDEFDFQIAHNAFVDEKGHLDVNIYVEGLKLMPSQKLDISIIFTAFKSCKGDYDGFKECKKNSRMCIWEGFFHDKNVNCPYDDCYDEGGCPVISPGGKRQSSGLGTKVTIGAVVLILGLLLLFMLCLFICRRCQVLCWSGPSAPRPQRPAQQTSRVEMTIPSDSIGVSSGHSLPSAPPLLPVSSATSPVHEDKDLPPPYESLFPSRVRSAQVDSREDLA